MIEPFEVETVLTELLGVSWNGIGRALDMGVLAFGAQVEFQTADGRTLTRTAFDLHLQCPFRISEGRFGMGSGDMARRGRSEHEETTLYDHVGERLDAHLKANPLAVTKVSAGRFGDFRLEVEEGFAIEVFVVSSRGESWRLVRRLDRGDWLLEDQKLVHVPPPQPIPPTPG